MSEPSDDLVFRVSEAATSIPEAGDLTLSDLPTALSERFDEAAVVALGEASHGTREFYEHRFRLTRLLVEEFGARAIGFEAGFDPLCRVAERVVAGEGEIRSLLAGVDVYDPLQVETTAALFEWLQSFNAGRAPEDRVHVYGFDMTIVEHAAIGIGEYLDRVGADVDASLREDLDTLTAGYDDDAERQAMLESAERVLSTLRPLMDTNESAWVEADSRRAYETVGHRLHLIEGQIEAHDRDHEGRMELRDETMAGNVEWIDDRSTGPVVLWGHNGHFRRGSHVLEEWDVDVPSMGEWLDDAYGDDYCPVAFDLGGGTVAATDGEVGELVDYEIPEPPSGSIPDLLRAVDEPLCCLSVAELHDEPPVSEWLRSEPDRHNIWGGHPDGDHPVNYRPSDLTEFDWLLFVRDTDPMVPLE